MSSASFSQNKNKKSLASPPENILLSLFSLQKRKGASVLGSPTRKSLLYTYSILKETSAGLLWPRNKGSGIWRKQTDPRLQSREDCPGNPKNIKVPYKFLVRIQPAALSWILCKTPWTLVIGQVTGIIAGLGLAVMMKLEKKKNHRLSVSGRKEMKAELVRGVRQEMVECRPASRSMTACSKTIQGAFPFANGWRGLPFRSEGGNDPRGWLQYIKSFVFATRAGVRVSFPFWILFTALVGRRTVQGITVQQNLHHTWQGLSGMCWAGFYWLGELIGSFPGILWPGC